MFLLIKTLNFFFFFFLGFQGVTISNMSWLIFIFFFSDDVFVQERHTAAFSDSLKDRQKEAVDDFQKNLKKLVYIMRTQCVR